MSEHSKLPWKRYGDTLLSADGKLVKMIFPDKKSPEDLDYITTACNAHYELLEALECFLRTWKKAGPSGSAQWEKFDTAVRLAQIAIEKGKP